MMKFFKHLAVVLAVVFVLPVGAQAQDFRFSFAGTEECLASEGTVDECVGTAARDCMTRNDGGETTVGMGYCLEQEWMAWDALLNMHYGEVRAQARAADAETAQYNANIPSQADALRDMQRAWIAFRDARCDYERSQWGGGTGGGPATLDCLMQTTARQALYLRAQRTD
ncbi:lysozyme inhibitor LprI family protein [Thalassococcus sp. BH17M4-6]|uniref:lysozyme inhibitor LprI family protein n=1 Tax=Thalassococcus sp. BH17M4-6 TaxID=3413148 RepID=UPI003BDB716B